MSCFYNMHNWTNGTGIPVAAPAKGQPCDCGETQANYDAATGALVWQWTPTGRLQGR